MKLNFKFSIFNTQNILLIAILAIAAFLRLYKIDAYLTFLGDQGRDVLVVYNILHGHLTLLGPTSSVGGFFLGPIYYYFMAPFLWLFNYNPVGPAVMVAIFGVITVWLLYKFCAELFNTQIALLVSFLYSISPLVIIYSKSSWNPNLMPFFSLLTLYTLYKASAKKNLKLFIISGILLGICLQLHYLSLFLGAIIFFYILLSESRTANVEIKNYVLDLAKKYLIFFLGFVIGWSPFLAFEVRHGFPDFKSLIEFLFHSGNTGAGQNFFFIIYDVFFRIFGRLIFAFPDIDHIQQYDKLVLNIWTILILCIAVPTTLFLAVNLYRSIKSENNDFRKYLLLALWFFVGIILFGFYKKSIYDYYFAFMFPLPFILFGNFAYWFYRKKKLNLIIKSFSIVSIAAIILVNAQTNPLWYPANQQLKQMRDIASFVMTKTDAKPFNFALLSGGNTDHAYRYFFTIWNHPPITIQYTGADPERKSVTDQLFVVCETLPCQPLGNSLWEIAGFGRAEIAGKWNISVDQVYKLVHYKGK